MAEKTTEELAAEAAAKEAADAAAKAAADAAKKKKIKFDPEQTEFINNLYSNGFAEGAKKVEEALKAQLAEEKAEREKLAKQLADLAAKKEEKKEPAANPEMDQFKAQMAEMQSVLGGIKQERDELKKRVEQADETSRKSRKKDKFLDAMKEAGVTFFDPLEAYDLAEKHGYEWDKDNDRPVVLNKETNRPKLNENGEPMSVTDFVKHFAETKKYLVKAPDQSGGTGAAGERRQERKEDTAEKSFADMTDEEFEAYTQKVQSKAR